MLLRRVPEFDCAQILRPGHGVEIRSLSQQVATKFLLILTAAIEGGPGLALPVSPSEVVTLLVGSAPDTPAGLVIRDKPTEASVAA